MIQNQKLKYFLDTKRGKTTQSFNIAKRWVEAGLHVQAFLSTYKTNKVKRVYRNTFLTESGNTYIITEVEGEAEDVLVERFINKTSMLTKFFMNKKDLSTLCYWIEQNDEVYASFFDNKDGKMAYTRRILHFDLDKRIMLSSDGKMYHIRSFNIIG